MRLSQVALSLCVLLSLHAGTNAQEQDESAKALPSFGQFLSVWSNEPLAWVSLSEENLPSNIFFDEIRLESGLKPINFEIMKQHVLHDEGAENEIGSGWRIESVLDGWSFAGGDEVRGRKPLGLQGQGRSSSVWLNEAIDDARFSTYGSLGLRAMHLEDSFYFEGRGSILGRTTVHTQIDHRVVGPQLGLGVVAEASILRFEAVALGLVGYGDAEINQRGVFGEEAIPGALNRSATARSTNSRAPTYHLDSYLALHGELRVSVGCQLTQSLRADVRWIGVYTGPVYSSGLATAWNAPDFGIHQPTSRDGYGDYWFLGLTYTH